MRPLLSASGSAASSAAPPSGLAAGVFSNNIDEVNTLSRGIKSGERQQTVAAAQALKAAARRSAT